MLFPLPQALCFWTAEYLTAPAATSSSTSSTDRICSCKATATTTRGTVRDEWSPDARVNKSQEVLSFTQDEGFKGVMKDGRWPRKHETEVTLATVRMSWLETNLKCGLMPFSHLRSNTWVYKSCKRLVSSVDWRNELLHRIAVTQRQHSLFKSS